MASSGCYQITLACESGVQRVLDEIINKNLPIETIMPSIDNAKKAGMLVHTYWIIGYPGETYEEIQKTVDFENFVNETNIKANLLLKQKDPERFKYKYGVDADESSLVKQT